MIRYDNTQWPLVLTATKGRTSLEEQSGFLQQWADWLARGETFATLRVFCDGAALEHPSGGGKEAKAWLQQNGAAIKNQVAAMATVVPPEHLEAVSRVNAEKLFGVPAQSFDALEPAIEWTLAHMPNAPAGLSCERVRDTLRQLMLD